MLTTVVSNGVTQPLLLFVAFFAPERRIFAQGDQQFIHVGDNALANRRVDAAFYFIQMGHENSLPTPRLRAAA
jgi:hypothetical protein